MKYGVNFRSRYVLIALFLLPALQAMDHVKTIFEVFDEEPPKNLDWETLTSNNATSRSRSNSETLPTQRNGTIPQHWRQLNQQYTDNLLRKLTAEELRNRELQRQLDELKQQLDATTNHLATAQKKISELTNPEDLESQKKTQAGKTRRHTYGLVKNRSGE